MIKDLGRLSRDLANAAASGVDATQAKRALEEWVKDVLFSHAEEEETTTYRAAGELPEGTLLIRSMLAEHALIRQTAGHVSAAADPMEAGTYRSEEHTSEIQSLMSISYAVLRLKIT